jgi:hypothetical protein
MKEGCAAGGNGPGRPDRRGGDGVSRDGYRVARVAHLGSDSEVPRSLFWQKLIFLDERLTSPRPQDRTRQWVTDLPDELWLCAAAEPEVMTK